MSVAEWCLLSGMVVSRACGTLVRKMHRSFNAPSEVDSQYEEIRAV